jgi:hypothetical protein
LDAKLARSGPNKHFEAQIIIPHPRLETLKQNLEVLYMKEQIIASTKQDGGKNNRTHRSATYFKYGQVGHLANECLKHRVNLIHSEQGEECIDDS